MSNKYLVRIHTTIWLILLIISLNTDGTGGGGDSITHFFIAQFSWTNPSLFFDLWGKPVFTLLASPFAQFGFDGISFFNISCGVLSSYFISISLKKENVKGYYLIPFIAFASPSYYAHLFTGLTEPLTGLFLSIGFYLLVIKKIRIAFIILSFLVFIRSEAIVFYPLFAIYALYYKKYLEIFFLLTGTVLYSLIGSFYTDNLFWVVDIPYTSSASVYGHGQWDHYVTKLAELLNWPMFGLMIIGILRAWLLQVKEKTIYPGVLLASLLILALFIAHSAVWYLGIFASAGLERVLLIVFPFIWIFILVGINLVLWPILSMKILRRSSYIILAFLLFSNIYFSPLRHYYWYQLVQGTEVENASRNGIILDLAQYNIDFLVVDDPFIGFEMNLNFKDPEARMTWNGYRYLFDQIAPEEYLLWDSYYAVSQYQIELDDLKEDSRLQLIKGWDYKERSYYLFQKL